MTSRIEYLAKIHDRKKFDCGHEVLNEYLRNNAGQRNKDHDQRTYVLVDDSDPSTILVYMTVRQERYNYGTEEKERWRSTLRLLKLATDKKFQGQGHGAILVQHALKLAVILDNSVGCCGVLVDAKGSAIDFYTRYGFKPMTPLPENIDQESIFKVFSDIRQIRIDLSES